MTKATLTDEQVDILMFQQNGQPYSVNQIGVFSLCIAFIVFVISVNIFDAIYDASDMPTLPLGLLYTFGPSLISMPIMFFGTRAFQRYWRALQREELYDRIYTDEDAGEDEYGYHAPYDEAVQARQAGSHSVATDLVLIKADNVLIKEGDK